MAVSVNKPDPYLQQITSISSAKRALREAYTDEYSTAYCNCRTKAGSVFKEECGYIPVPENSRSFRIEWEHVIPVSWFGRNFKSWTEGDPSCVRKSGEIYKGRACAWKVSEEFRRMASDIMNLVPVLGGLNARRSERRFAEISGEERLFGSCDFELAERSFEPPEEFKGDAARIAAYMQEQYPDKLVLSDAQRELLDQWAKEDPPSEEELELKQRKRVLMGLSSEEAFEELREQIIQVQPLPAEELQPVETSAAPMD